MLFGVIGRAGVPKNVNLEISRNAPSLLPKPGFEILQMLSSDRGGDLVVLGSRGTRIGAPHPGHELIPADLAGASFDPIIGAGLNQADGFQLRESCLGVESEREEKCENFVHWFVSYLLEWLDLIGFKENDTIDLRSVVQENGK